MNRESFLETVRQRLADEIHEAYVECEHDDGRTVDFTKLDQHLAKLMKNAKAEGVTAQEFQDLVRSTLPDHYEKLALSKTTDRVAA